MCSKELKDKIIEKFRERGLLSEKLDIDEENVLRFIEKYVSDENVEKMIASFDRYTFDSYERYFFQWDKSGLIATIPKIWSEEEEIPSLCVAYDKYLHWFRGYHFQISATPYGDTSVITPCSRLDAVMSGLSCAELPELELGRKAIFVAAALTPLLQYYSCSTEILQNEAAKVEIDKFLELSTKLERGLNSDVSVDSILQFVNVSNTMCIADSNCVMLSKSEEENGYAILGVDTNSAFVCGIVNGKQQTVRITIPKVIKLAAIMNYSLYEVCMHVLMEFLFAYAGIRANYVAMYPCINYEPLKRGTDSVCKYEHALDFVVATIQRVLQTRHKKNLCIKRVVSDEQGYEFVAELQDGSTVYRKQDEIHTQIKNIEQIIERICSPVSVEQEEELPDDIYNILCIVTDHKSERMVKKADSFN